MHTKKGFEDSPFNFFCLIVLRFFFFSKKRAEIYFFLSSSGKGIFSFFMMIISELFYMSRFWLLILLNNRLLYSLFHTFSSPFIQLKLTKFNRVARVFSICLLGGGGWNRLCIYFFSAPFCKNTKLPKGTGKNELCAASADAAKHTHRTVVYIYVGILILPAPRLIVISLCIFLLLLFFLHKRKKSMMPFSRYLFL